jgi:hypothetical protein
MIISFIFKRGWRKRVAQDRTDRNAGLDKLILTVKTSLRSGAAHSLNNRALKCMQRTNIGFSYRFRIDWRCLGWSYLITMINPYDFVHQPVQYLLTMVNW